jgi:hypothetical protein
MQQWKMSSSDRGQCHCQRRLRRTTEMKNLQVEEKVVQAQKIARQAQLEPLQEKVEQLVMEIDAAKACLKHIGLEGGEILRPPVTVQVVEAMSAKSIQAQEQCQQIVDMYEALAQAVADTGVRK